jgi:hypothetical protein
MSDKLFSNTVNCSSYLAFNGYEWEIASSKLKELGWK